jgi:cobalamin biosynthesis protein CobT
MALSKMFKKTNAPYELPDLAIDELKKDLKKDYSEKEEIKEPVPEVKEVNQKTEEKVEEIQEEQPPTEELPEEDSNKSEDSEENKEDNSDKDEDSEENKEDSIESKEELINLEKSFFNPLINELKKENFDPAKINAWYQKRFSDKSVIEEMKEYWEKQKNEFITEAVEKEFRARINEKMHNLQKLESEWQEVYIKLAEKEEEMKKEEKTIKKIIKDFSEVVRRKGNLKKAHKTR